MANIIVKKEILVKPEYQATDIYCGAACAEMVLNSLGVKHLTQAKLYSQSHNFPTIDAEKTWKSSPDGLRYTLNFNKGEFKGKFGLYFNERQSEIARRIVWSIFH